jgi:hypothetical protein
MKGTPMKKLVLIAVASLAGYLALRVYFEGHLQVIIDRFPDIPEQDVRTAYRVMMKRALTDPNFDCEGKTAEEMDAMLLAIIKEQPAS